MAKRTHFRSYTVLQATFIYEQVLFTSFYAVSFHGGLRAGVQDTIL
jgi:hypothetical protein